MRRKALKANKTLPGDSASDITELEEESILFRYFEQQMTVTQRRAKERIEVQQRLYGECKNESIYGHKNCNHEKGKPKKSKS